MKPSIKIKAPHPHVDAKKRKKGVKKKYNSNFGETYETFRRAYGVNKCAIDCVQPKHMNRFKKKKKSKKK